MTVTPEQMQARRPWIEALRSGEYRQARGALAKRMDDGSISFCCLGVLCDISGLGPWSAGGDAYHTGYNLVYTYNGRNYAGSKIPEELSELMGLSDGTIQRLANLNDTGYGFDEIAGVLETGDGV